jgi:hypothetical protein
MSKGLNLVADDNDSDVLRHSQNTTIMNETFTHDANFLNCSLFVKNLVNAPGMEWICGVPTECWMVCLLVGMMLEHELCSLAPIHCQGFVLWYTKIALQLFFILLNHK